MSSDFKLKRRGFLKLAGVSFGCLFLKEASKDTRSLGFIHSQRRISEEKIKFLSQHEVDRGDTSRKVILITYDDLGNTEQFAKILDAFKKYSAKASFFLPGGYDRKYITLPLYEETIKSIVGEGHALGCHGLIHEPLTSYKNQQLRNDLEQWLDIIVKILPNYNVQWIRFPFGNRDDRVRKIAAEYGFQSVMWSLESGGQDDKTLSRVINGAANGAIVLSHVHRFYDIRFSQEILKDLTNRGYRIESVDTGLSSDDYYRDESSHPAGLGDSQRDMTTTYPGPGKC